jgi:hypothetical protein
MLVPKLSMPSMLLRTSATLRHFAALQNFSRFPSKADCQAEFVSALLSSPESAEPAAHQRRTITNSKPLPFPSDAIPEVTSDGNESLGVMVKGVRSETHEGCQTQDHFTI